VLDSEDESELGLVLDGELELRLELDELLLELLDELELELEERELADDSSPSETSATSKIRTCMYGLAQGPHGLQVHGQ